MYFIFTSSFVSIKIPSRIKSFNSHRKGKEKNYLKYDYFWSFCRCYDYFYLLSYFLIKVPWTYKILFRFTISFVWIFSSKCDHLNRSLGNMNKMIATYQKLRFVPMFKLKFSKITIYIVKNRTSFCVISFNFSICVINFFRINSF